MKERPHILQPGQVPERKESWKRVHFSCDGTIALLSGLPEDFFRAGDTASGTEPEVDEEIFAWTCEIDGDELRWRKQRLWTHAVGKELIDAADFAIFLTNFTSDELLQQFCEQNN